jgi:hypothetical protein
VKAQSLRKPVSHFIGATVEGKPGAFPRYGTAFDVYRFMDYGLWIMVYGLWFMVYGLWFMVYGLWFMVYDLGFRV